MALVSIVRGGCKVAAHHVHATHDDGEELWLELAIGVTQFGRGRRPPSDRPRVDIDDSGLSRHHFDIVCSGSEVVAKFGSHTGGTIINDERVCAPSRPLKAGDVIRLGFSPGARLVVRRVITACDT